MRKLIALLLICSAIHAQTTTGGVVDNITFPMNKYLCLNCNGKSIYPDVRHSAFLAQALDTLNGLHVEDFGLKGDGSTLNDNKITAAVNAATSTGKTLIFSNFKTYMFSTQTEINIPAGSVLKVWAKGATLKMANQTRYSMLQFISTQNYGADIIWVGGTLDGNQTFQKYPNNPRGGVYNTADFVEAHGSLILADLFNNVTFYGVHVINTVVDGISSRRSFLTEMLFCDAQDGANLQYSATSEQGTYFKVTRSGYKNAYFINISAIGGSIGIHCSFEQNKTFDTTTQCMIVNYYSKNNIQNALHIEDCAKTICSNMFVDNDLGNITYPQILFSNKSTIVSIQNSYFRNQLLSFSNATNLRLGFVNYCTFITDIPTSSSARLRTFIEGATHVANTTFAGQPDGVLVKSFYVHNCKFTNYGTTDYAVNAAYMVDSSTFVGGKAINFRSGNSSRSYYNTFTNTTGGTQTNTTPPAGWEHSYWDSRINITTKNRTRTIKAK